MDSCTVETKYGAVRGEIRDGVCVWRGIPYAAAPIGALRFADPQPPAGWEGVRDAIEFGPSCPQGSRSRHREIIRDMSEDCLFLNIWAPAKAKSAVPVFFYIHGGSFIEGAGSDAEYEGTNIVSEGDIILVTVNYRMGVLGFMDFSCLDKSFKANCGIRDLVHALKWVYENIAAFGGDPENITVGGQSAGASCAAVLSMLDDARPYMKRVIMMSGVPSLLHQKEHAQDIAKRYLEYMDVKNAESLRSVQAEKIAESQSAFAQDSGLGVAAFGLSVDGELIKEFIIPAAVEGKMQGIPMLFGTTREEMSFAFIKSLAYIVDIERIRKTGTAAESEEVKNRIQNSYAIYGKRGPATMFSDFSFRMPNIWFAEAQSKYADIWMYRFDFETLGMRISKLYSFHSSDVPFLFGNFKAGLAKYMTLISPVKIRINKMHREMMGDFLTFIKTGELSWEKCSESKTPAKCYNLPPRVEPAVPENIVQAFEVSEYRRRSFRGEGLNL